MEVSFSPLKVFFPTRSSSSSSSSSFIIEATLSFKNQFKKTPQKPFLKFTPSTPNPISLSNSLNSHQSSTLLPDKPSSSSSSSSINKTNLFHLTFLSTTLSSAVSCFAADTVLPAESSNKINLEAIVVSIDNFFNRYPFFVAGVTFIWLVVIPLTEEYLQKYKFISSINAFKKLKNDPSTQLLDIRDDKSLQYMGSPNLKIMNKNALQVEFVEGDEDGFVKKVLEKFPQPADTVICILDNFDGNSMKVAELLVKNGFKETYAVRGGIRGKNGWQEIQENLLPPSVHIYPKKKNEKVKKQGQLDTNGGVNQSDINGQATPFSTSTDSGTDNGKPNNNIVGGGYVMKSSSRPSSPYPNYPDLKPPSSPTPSKPRS
ncbi:rhodanese-like domain-containing protein 4A, chloroplastic [Impatiens glandulifera]|uniref:rhodanese-like domain-containing protein 4A, chloroplastic n=1 Tax=Impatiens glandulifera TaxID=253017 RepID=UPI001FB1613F|nr:rhodanese-like domain-containing protein 4A, chloroplastic [Impatiens glandulifera]